MITIIIAEEDGDDLVFHIVDRGKSPLYRLEGKASSSKGNPYLVYGKHAEEWVGAVRYSLTLIVAHVSSGSLLR